MRTLSNLIAGLEPEVDAVQIVLQSAEGGPVMQIIRDRSKP